MATLTRLLEHQSALLRDIQDAARKRDAQAVLALQKKLESLASLIRRQEEIDRALAELEHGSAAGPVTPAIKTSGPVLGDDHVVSAKERGRRHREDFVRKLSGRGVMLHRLKGAVFKSPRGTRVGIAYGREGKNDQGFNGKWFLGLPENRFDQAVLLCEDGDGMITHFSLTKEFIGEYSEALTRKNGQVKFNVVRRGGEFFLHVPTCGPVLMEPFRDNLSGLI